MNDDHPPAAGHDAPAEAAPVRTQQPDAQAAAPREIGGPRGPEPTRYGDWERMGRCYDF